MFGPPKLVSENRLCDLISIMSVTWVQHLSNNTSLSTMGAYSRRSYPSILNRSQNPVLNNLIPQELTVASNIVLP